MQLSFLNIFLTDFETTIQSMEWEYTYREYPSECIVIQQNISKHYILIANNY